MENNLNNEYGLSLMNPVRLNSISSSVAYLENLVTEKGYHFLFHRVGCKFFEHDNASQLSEILKHPIDHYRLIDGDCKYHDIFISIYSEENDWTPPKGFLFENSYFNTYDDIFDDIEIAEEYVYVRDSDLDLDNLDNLDTELKKLPFLERKLFQNFGITSRDNQFPLGVLKSYLKNELNDKGEIFENLKTRLEL